MKIHDILHIIIIATYRLHTNQPHENCVPYLKDCIILLKCKLIVRISMAFCISSLIRIIPCFSFLIDRFYCTTKQIKVADSDF